jgi:hypothetical protein
MRRYGQGREEARLKRERSLKVVTRIECEGNGEKTVIDYRSQKHIIMPYFRLSNKLCHTKEPRFKQNNAYDQTVLNVKFTSRE